MVIQFAECQDSVSALPIQLDSHNHGADADGQIARVAKSILRAVLHAGLSVSFEISSHNNLLSIGLFLLGVIMFA
jgi:hypothetical protein